MNEWNGIKVYSKDEIAKKRKDGTGIEKPFIVKTKRKIRGEYRDVMLLFKKDGSKKLRIVDDRRRVKSNEVDMDVAKKAFLDRMVKTNADIKERAKITYSKPNEKWLKHPERYDVEGIDTPGSSVNIEVASKKQMEFAEPAEGEYDEKWEVDGGFFDADVKRMEAHDRQWHNGKSWLARAVEYDPSSRFKIVMKFLNGVVAGKKVLFDIDIINVGDLLVKGGQWNKSRYKYRYVVKYISDKYVYLDEITEKELLKILKSRKN